MNILSLLIVLSLFAIGMFFIVKHVYYQMKFSFPLAASAFLIAGLCWGYFSNETYASDYNQEKEIELAFLIESTKDSYEDNHLSDSEVYTYWRISRITGEDFMIDIYNLIENPESEIHVTRFNSIQEKLEKTFL